MNKSDLIINYMGARARKWLLWGSLSGLILSIGGEIYINLIPFSDFVDNFQLIFAFLIILLVLNLLVLLAFRLRENKLFNLFAKLSVFLLPVACLGLYFAIYNAENTILIIVVEIVATSIIVLSALFMLIYIFLLRDAGEIRGVLVLLSLITICIALQRLAVSFYLNTDVLLPVSIFVTAMGIYMYGFRCLLIIEKNRYLKFVSFIACSLTTFGGLLFFFKMIDNSIENLEWTYFILAFLMTLIVLLSLPISGYVNWILSHKKILKKIMISWLFFFLIFSIRFVFPEYFKIIEREDYKSEYHFDMEDYDIQNKNGLEYE